MLFRKKFEQETLDDEFQEETLIFINGQFVKENEEVDSNACDPQKRNE